MSTKDYDVVIIGGGIHGAGAAQAAAAAGYSVLVIEQTALAAGTSSKSSKLIHGGLRYLESGQFNLVKECLHERSLLLKNAPDLVELKPFYIPIYEDTKRRPWEIRAGLSLYFTLGGLGPDTRFRVIPKKEWRTLDGLDQQALEKVFCYFDAQTDDKALTEAVMHSAQTLGVELVMPAEFLAAEKCSHGYNVRYRTNETEFECNTSLLINAAGPWANHVLSKITPKVTEVGVDLVQGTHIILDEAIKHMYYVEAPEDKRAVFVLPWKGKMMVGTTESFFHGNPKKVIPLAKEKQYLLQTLGYYFPKFRHTHHSDIREAFAGLRVLPRTTGEAFSRPRDTIFHPDSATSPHLVTIYGGKLTAYRATSENLINQFKHVLPAKKPVANTRELKLPPV